MRVSTKMLFNQIGSSIINAQDEALGAQERVSTGKRVLRPSDDPSSVSKILNYRTIGSNIDQYNRNLNIAQGRLESADSSMVTASNIVQRLKELAISQTNGASSAEDRKITAAEAQQLFSEMVGIANTKTESGYLFAGFSTNTQPFQTNGSLTSGINVSGQIGIQIDGGMTITANISGDTLFKGAGGHVEISSSVSNSVLDSSRVPDSSSMAFTGQPAAGDKFTLQGKTYEFINAGGSVTTTGAIPITIGAALTNTIDNMASTVTANSVNISTTNVGGTTFRINSINSGTDILTSISNFVAALNSNRLSDSTNVAFTAQPTAGDAFTLQGKTYEFNSGGPLVNAGAVPITIGAALTNTIDNAVTAITSNATNVTVTNSGGTSLQITSTGPGTSTFVKNVGVPTNQTVTNSTSVQSAIADMDEAIGQILNARADIGARLGRIDGVRERLSSLKLSNTTATSNEEEIDLAKAVTDFTAKQQALEIARSASARLLDIPTLIDFLK